MGMRKLPGNFKQYQVIRAHAKSMGHDDTKLWFTQAFTGFAMFFLGSVHLYVIMTNSADIGPYESADRVWSEYMWPLYIILLLAVWNSMEQLVFIDYVLNGDGLMVKIQEKLEKHLKS